MLSTVWFIPEIKGFPYKPVVRTWNKRAVNCYKSQLFEIVETKHQKHMPEMVNFM